MEIKKKYKNKVMSNGKVGRFNTKDIAPKEYQYYYDNGFAHIFTVKKSDD